MHIPSQLTLPVISEWPMKAPATWRALEDTTIRFAIDPAFRSRPFRRGPISPVRRIVFPIYRDLSDLVESTLMVPVR